MVVPQADNGHAPSQLTLFKLSTHGLQTSLGYSFTDIELWIARFDWL